MTLPRFGQFGSHRPLDSDPAGFTRDGLKCLAPGGWAPKGENEHVAGSVCSGQGCNSRERSKPRRVTLEVGSGAHWGTAPKGRRPRAEGGGGKEGPAGALPSFRRPPGRAAPLLRAKGVGISRGHFRETRLKASTRTDTGGLLRARRPPKNNSWGAGGFGEASTFSLDQQSPKRDFSRTRLKLFSKV